MFQQFAPGYRAFIQGASRGIGLAFVNRLLADAGAAHVFASCRRPDRAEALQTLCAQHPRRLTLLALDAGSEASIADAARELAARTGRLQLLINSAGLLHDGDMRPEKRLDEVREENLQRSFAVNASGPLLVAKHCLPLLRHDERAVLANISARVGSIADNRLGGWYAYRASKAAQNMLTRTLAIELGRVAKNVLCVALHPGTTATGLSAPFRSGVPADKLFSTERCVGQLAAVIDGLGDGDSGKFFAWDGREIPW